MLIWAIKICAAYAGYVGLNILLADMNTLAKSYRHLSGNPKKINEPCWGLIYVALCIPVYSATSDWGFFLSVALLHLSIYPYIFNKLLNSPAFYLPKRTNAWSGKLMLAMGLTDTFAVSAVSLTLSLALLTITIINGRF